MSRSMYALIAMVALVGSTGCCTMDRLLCHPWGCGVWGGGSCGKGGCGAGDCSTGHGGCGDAGCSSCGHQGPLARHHANKGHHLAGHHEAYKQYPRGAGGEQVGMAGPPTAGVTYPYYTNRGPRDFLARNPQSIGP